MIQVNPLPFKLGVPGEETINLGGMESTGYQMVGQLHLDNLTLIVEWTGSRTTEKIGFSGISRTEDRLPVEELEIPVGYISGANLIGGWWRPSLELRGMRLDLFDDLPGSKPGSVRLRIKHRDRDHALDFIMALEAAQDSAALDAGENYEEITDGEVNRLGDGSTSEF